VNLSIKSREAAAERTEKRLPPPGQPVVVRCLCFECLAYRDETGIWKGRYDGKELPEVLEWAPA